MGASRAGADDRARGRAKATKRIVEWLQMWSEALFMDEDAESRIMSRMLKEAANKITHGEHLKKRKKAKS